MGPERPPHMLLTGDSSSAIKLEFSCSLGWVFLESVWLVLGSAILAIGKMQDGLPPWHSQQSLLWSLDQQHKHHLGACRKCRLSSPALDLLNGVLRF